MHDVGRRNKGVALDQTLRHPADRDIEGALANITALNMRVGMQRADSARLESDFDHHHFRQIKTDAPGDAPADI